MAKAKKDRSPRPVNKHVTGSFVFLHKVKMDKIPILERL